MRWASSLFPRLTKKLEAVSTTSRADCADHAALRTGAIEDVTKSGRSGSFAPTGWDAYRRQRRAHPRLIDRCAAWNSQRSPLTPADTCIYNNHGCQGAALDYRKKVSDPESASMWQSLSFGANYKAAYCLSVCPAAERACRNNTDAPQYILCHHYRSLKYTSDSDYE